MIDIKEALDKGTLYGDCVSMYSHQTCDNIMEAFVLLKKQYLKTQEELLEKKGIKLKNFHFIVIPVDDEEDFAVKSIEWFAEKEDSNDD